MNLQSRILYFFVALLLVIQLASFSLIRNAIEINARSNINTQLEVGERILFKTLQAHGQKLADQTHLLATDEELKNAFVSNDPQLMNTALVNRQDIPPNTSVYLFNSDFQLLAGRGFAFSFQNLNTLKSKALMAHRTSSYFLASDGEFVYQYTVSPLKTFASSGWIVTKLLLDATVLSDLKNLSGFDSSLVITLRHGNSKITASSFSDEDQFKDLVSTLTIHDAQRTSTQGHGTMDVSFPEQIHIGEVLFGSRSIALSHDGETTTYALLLQSIDKAREPYTHLQWTLGFLGLGGLLTFIFGAYLLARSISRPIVELSKAAESFARGDFAVTLPQKSPGEVGQLADSFDRMRVALGEREQKIHKLAYWDNLTGLPNREQYREKFSSLLEKTKPLAQPSVCSILHLDIDRLKNVNDTLGLPAGDQLLKEIAKRLSQIPLKTGGFPSRLNGDKFAILLPNTSTNEAMDVAEKIHRAFELPAIIGPSRIDISAGIGICSIPQHALSMEDAMARAEVAMYAAKQARKPSLVYEPQLDNTSEDSLSLLSDLREAIHKTELVLHFQPKIDLDSGEIIGAEALARWMHPIRGFMPPSSFIPFAEQTGFIGQISKWAVHQSCKTITELSERGYRIKISANISTRDLLDADFITSLKDSLALNCADPSLLCLEVTESALMDQPERSIQAMHLIRNLGVELSIDDFGTGYSSLGYLRKMPINELKIDRVFILGLTSGSVIDEKIVTSTIELAHGLELRVVAEGVEDPRSFQKLRLAKCDQAQGYGISKPLPQSEFYKFLQDWHPSKTPGSAPL